jgi:hypothetical protein
MAFFRGMEFKGEFAAHSGGYFITGWVRSAMVVGSRHDVGSAALVFSPFSLEFSHHGLRSLAGGMDD